PPLWPPACHHRLCAAADAFLRKSPSSSSGATSAAKSFPSTPPLSSSAFMALASSPATSSLPNRSSSFAGRSATRKPRSASSARSVPKTGATPTASPSSTKISISGKSTFRRSAPRKGSWAFSRSSAAIARLSKRWTTPAPRPTSAPPTKASSASANAAAPALFGSPPPQLHPPLLPQRSNPPSPPKRSWRSSPSAASPTAPAAPGGNRRKHPRVKVDYSACVRVPGRADDVVQCEDMSKGGLRFKSRQRYYAQSLIEVAVPFQPGQPAIFVPAQIVFAEELPEQRLFRCGVQYLKATKPRDYF